MSASPSIQAATPTSVPNNNSERRIGTWSSSLPSENFDGTRTAQLPSVPTIASHKYVAICSEAGWLRSSSGTTQAASDAKIAASSIEPISSVSFFAQRLRGELLIRAVAPS